MGGMGRWVVFLGLQRGGVLRARGIPVRHGKNLRLMRGLLRPRGSPSPLAVLARDFVNKLNEKRRKKGGKGRATWGLLRPRILPFLASRVAQPIDRCCAALLPRRRLRRRLPLRRRGFAARQHVAAVSATTARSRDPEGELQVHSGWDCGWPAADRSDFWVCGNVTGALRVEGNSVSYGFALGVGQRALRGCVRPKGSPSSQRSTQSPRAPAPPEG